MAEPYREPDLRERVRELEKEIEELEQENSRIKRGRVWVPFRAVGRGIDYVWTWFWGSGAFVVVLAAVLIGGIGILIRHADKQRELKDRPHADATVDLNGHQAFALHCSNVGADCAVLAGRSCPHGYEVTKEMPDGLLIVCKEEKK